MPGSTLIETWINKAYVIDENAVDLLLSLKLARLGSKIAQLDIRHINYV